MFSRYIVGWQVSHSLHTDLALDALNMTIWNRQRNGADLSGLIHHSYRGVQGGLDRFNHRRLHGELGLLPSAEHEAAHHATHPERSTAPATVGA